MVDRDYELLEDAERRAAQSAPPLEPDWPPFEGELVERDNAATVARQSGDGEPAGNTPAVPKPRIVNPSSLSGKPVPARRWLVPQWIPIGVVTLLYGDGGLGKSLLAQQLQTSTALGCPWLGLYAENVASLGVYCEDDEDELWRRQVDFNTHHNCALEDVRESHWMPRVGEDNLLMTFTRSGLGELTKFHAHVLEAALDLRARLTIIDTVADTFGGNEIDRSQVRQFVGRALGSIARATDGAVVACAHPSRAGMSTGSGDSGSTGWSNTSRSRMFLSGAKVDEGGPPDPDARILTRKKANYAARHDEVRLHWRNGVIVPDEVRGVSAFRRPAEEVFMSLLDAFTSERQELSHNSRASNYAPTLFCRRAEREGYVRANFESALQSLLAKRAIEIVGYGPPSKGWRKIVRAA